MRRARLLTVPLPPPEAEVVLADLRRMARERYNATKDEHARIVEAIRKGARQAEVARAIDRSREHVRKVYDRWLEEQRENAS